ncbi:MAG TPA: hypothetical protein VIK01_12005 [Polyangiaceae bacterium]
MAKSTPNSPAQAAARMQSDEESLEIGSHIPLFAVRPLALLPAFLILPVLASCGGTARDDTALSGAGASGSSAGVERAPGGAATSDAPSNADGGWGGISSAAGAQGGEGGLAGASEAGADLAAGTPKIDEAGYVRISTGTETLLGYVASYVGGSESSITLSYTSASFCASGTVGINSAFQSYAGAGFNVNQAQSAAGNAVDSLLLTGNSFQVRFSNSAHSPLWFQVINSSNITWCYDLSRAVSPVTVPFSRLNTRCWDGTGDAFVPTTPITAIQLIVPGSATHTTPFDFCLGGLVIQ